MAVLFLCLFLGGAFFIRSRHDLDNEDILTTVSVIFLLGICLLFFIFYFTIDELEPDFYYLFFLPFFIFSMFFISKKIKPKSLAIAANTQRYFKVAQPQDIVKFYSHRRDIKPDRIEVLVNKDSKKLIKNGVIVPQFFVDLANFHGTKIKNLEDIEKNAVFAVVFAKLKEFVKASEARVDFETKLKENDFIAEYFLLNLWEEHTKPFNISVANLEIVATNANDIEFLGALDLLNLNCVKRKGAVLFYKYMEFKGRIENVKDSPIEDENIQE